MPEWNIVRQMMALHLQELVKHGNSYTATEAVVDAVQAPLLEAVRAAYDTLQTIHYANAGDSPQTTEMARLASEALRPFLPESEGKKE